MTFQEFTFSYSKKKVSFSKLIRQRTLFDQKKSLLIAVEGPKPMMSCQSQQQQQRASTHMFLAAAAGAFISEKPLNFSIY